MESWTSSACSSLDFLQSLGLLTNEIKGQREIILKLSAEVASLKFELKQVSLQTIDAARRITAKQTVQFGEIADYMALMFADESDAFLDDEQNASLWNIR